jgi:purine-binding chemotaxis protein CheW
MDKDDNKKNDISRILITNIGDHYFGAAIDEIHDVIQRQRTTQVPLTRPNIIGLLNLRGHIVTEIDMAKTLEIDVDLDNQKQGEYSIVISYENELYSLAFDGIGDVINIQNTAIEHLPETINRRWHSMSKGVYRLPDKLLVILDLKTIIGELTHSPSVAV